MSRKSLPVMSLVLVLAAFGLTGGDGNGLPARAGSDNGRGREQAAGGRGHRHQHNEQQLYEKGVVEILKGAEERMQQIYARKREIFYSLTQGHSYDSNHRGSFMQDIDLDEQQLLFELAGNLSDIPVAKIRDGSRRRQVQRLAKLQLQGLQAQDYKESRKLLHTMQAFLTDRIVCMDECSQLLPLQPKIISHIVRTKNLHDLNYFWLQWRQQLAERDQVAKSSFVDYVRLWRKAAAANGNRSPTPSWSGVIRMTAPH